MKAFVTGTYRSGSTLLAYIINAAGIHLKEETVNFMRFCYGRYGKERVSIENAIKMGEEVNDRLDKRFNLSFDLEHYKEIVIAQDIPLTYSFLYGTIMRLFAGTDNWGEKTVLEWRSSEAILEMFDDMRIVHIIRDPRDVLASWKRETIAPGKDYLDCVANCYDSMLYSLINKEKFGERYLVVRFESLIDNAEKEVERLCEFIGVPFRRSILHVDRYESKLSDKKWDPNLQSAFDEDIQGISKIPVGRWKSHLPREDIFLCELVNGELMKKFGYRISGYEWNIHDFFRVIEKIQQSPLTYNGLTSVAHFKKGVQRYAIDPLNPAYWGEVEQ